VWGDQRGPCSYTFSAGKDIEYVVPALPVITIFVGGAINLLFCSGTTGIASVSGTAFAAVTPTGFNQLPAPWSSILEYQIASIGVGIQSNPVPMGCNYESDGTISKSGATNLVARVIKLPNGRDVCNCLKNNFQVGVIFTVGGPFIPGIIMIPILTAFFLEVLIPFMPFVTLQPAVSMIYYPYFCGLTQQTFSFQLPLVINFGLASYSLNVFSPSWTAVQNYNGLRLPIVVGTYTTMPIDDILNLGNYATREAGVGFKALQSLLNSNGIPWVQILAMGGALKNAASAYFNSAQNTASAALKNIFAPPKPVCVTTGGNCKVKIMGKCILKFPSITVCV
jgi:hypothetical protein